MYILTNSYLYGKVYYSEKDRCIYRGELEEPSGENMIPSLLIPLIVVGGITTGVACIFQWRVVFYYTIVFLLNLAMYCLRYRYSVSEENRIKRSFQRINVTDMSIKQIKQLESIVVEGQACLYLPVQRYHATFYFLAVVCILLLFIKPEERRELLYGSTLFLECGIYISIFKRTRKRKKLLLMIRDILSHEINQDTGDGTVCSDRAPK